MGTALAKVGMGAFFIFLTAQVGTLTEEILGKVRMSVQASELLMVDSHLGVWAIEQRRTRGPRDQAEFEQACRAILASRGGRDVTLDRWQRPYLYQHLGDVPVSWRITSKGPDRTLGTVDDLVVERHGDNSEINHDPVELAELAIEMKQAHDREMLARLRTLVDEAKGEAGAEPSLELDDAAFDQEQLLQETLNELEELL